MWVRTQRQTTSCATAAQRLGEEAMSVALLHTETDFAAACAGHCLRSVVAAFA